MGHLKIFQFSLQRVRRLAEAHAFPYKISAYIYIYIDLLISPPCYMDNIASIEWLVITSFFMKFFIIF